MQTTTHLYHLEPIKHHSCHPIPLMGQTHNLRTIRLTRWYLGGYGEKSCDSDCHGFYFSAIWCWMKLQLLFGACSFFLGSRPWSCSLKPWINPEVNGLTCIDLL